MKKVSMKIALVALMVAAGTMGLQAQRGNRTGICGAGTCLIGTSGTGTCVNSTLLTDEQKAILEDLRVTFQAEMAVLRAEMMATTILADKLVIRQTMTTLRDAHLAEVKALLDSWGVPASATSKKAVNSKGKGK